MKKIMKLLKYDKNTMAILNIITIIGIITGSIFIIILSKQDKENLVNSLNNYFKFVQIKNISLNYLKNIFFNNSITLFSIWILGISVVGILFVLFIIFYKAFILGFTVSALIYTYSSKGIILSLAYIFPHLIINLLVYLFIASYSFKLSIILFKAIIKKENLNFKLFINGYVKIFFICLIILILTSFYEATFNPIIVNYIKNLM